jgi:hypothetical protein
MYYYIIGTGIFNREILGYNFSEPIKVLDRWILLINIGFASLSGSVLQSTNKWFAPISLRTTVYNWWNSIVLIIGLVFPNNQDKDQQDFTFACEPE